MVVRAIPHIETVVVFFVCRRRRRKEVNIIICIPCAGAERVGMGVLG